MNDATTVICDQWWMNTQDVSVHPQHDSYATCLFDKSAEMGK